MSSPRRPPPALARRIFRRLAPGDLGASVLRELDLEYAAGDRGRFWYWRQALGSVRWLRAEQRRGASTDPSLPRRRKASGRNGASPAERLRLDLRHARRGLRTRPLSTALAVVTLALGVGVASAVFSSLEGIVLRPLPYRAPERLVRVWPDALFFTQIAEFLELAPAVDEWLDLSAYGRSLPTLTDGAEAEVVRGAVVSPDHFALLGAPLLHGAGFQAEHGEPGAPPVAVLGHALWSRRYGADPQVVGQTIEVNGSAVRVVGVTARDHVPIEHDWEIWFPLEMRVDGRSAGNALAAVGRLRDGASAQEASAGIRAAFRNLWTARGAEFDEGDLLGARAAPLRDWLLGDSAGAAWALFGAALALLAIVAGNLANLQLAQVPERRREAAIQAALGAGSGRLLRQNLLESLIVALLGGVTGLALAAGVLQLVRSRLPAGLPRAANVGMNESVPAFAFATALVVVLVAAALPAWRASRPHAMTLVGAARTASPGRGSQRLAVALIVVEAALCVVVVVSAGLMLRTLWNLSGAETGFRAAGVVSLRPAPPAVSYPEAADVAAYHARAREALARAIDVESVGGIMFLPMRSGGWRTGVRAPALVDPVSAEMGTSLRVVTAGYFETLEVPLLAGRTFRVDDEEAAAEPTAVVNATLARELWRGTDPVGQEIVLGNGDRRRVVGVVGDVKQADVETPAEPEAYVPYGARPWRQLYLVARVRGDASARVAELREAVARIDPRVPITDAAALDQVVSGTFADRTLLAGLLASFGATATALGMAGVYGVTACAVNRRRREIGIRMALGANGRSVLARTVGGGLLPVLAGVVVGLAAALATSGLLSSLLFEVAPLDVATFTVAPLLLLATAVLALLQPALRASRVDPHTVLRESGT